MVVGYIWHLLLSAEICLLKFKNSVISPHSDLLFIY